MPAVSSTTSLTGAPASATAPTYLGASAPASTKEKTKKKKQKKKKEVRKKEGNKGKKNWTRRPTIINGEKITFSSHKEAVFVIKHFLGKHAPKQNPRGCGKSRSARRRANKKAWKEAEEEQRKEKGTEER